MENDWCANQAFAVDNILALQCHVEMTAPMVQEWSTLYAHELDNPAPGVQSAAQMTAKKEVEALGSRGNMGTEAPQSQTAAAHLGKSGQRASKSNPAEAAKPRCHDAGKPG